MSKYRNLLAGAAVALTLSAGPVLAEEYGLGRPALADEIAAWDVDVRPDGTGLPAGSGSVEDGEELFSDYCAICHGDFAEGVDNWPKLSGGMDTLDHEDPLKTVGSYWPYLSTTWDYVNRSMPFGNAQSLEVDEVYAVVAYILYSNDMVEEDFVLNSDNFLDVEMANTGGFIIDDRSVTEYPRFSQGPCMSDCKGVVEVIMRAAVLDVTPEETRARQIQEMIESTNPRNKAEPTPEEAKAEEPAEVVVVADPVLLAAGEKVFKKCKACHQVGEGAKKRTGPVLNGVVNGPAGASDGFKYSKVMKSAAEAGLIWNQEELTAFLTKPKGYMKGTKMSFAGLKKEADIAAVIAYLGSFAH
jgi:cytochrome c2